MFGRIRALLRRFVIPRKTRHIIVLARHLVGYPYVFGGTSPRQGFDCSGLIYYLFGTEGVRLPRESQDQWRKGDPIALHGLREGDVVFFRGAKPPYPDHEGLYIGSGLFIEAPHTGEDVRISHLKGYPGFMGARRYIR